MKFNDKIYILDGAMGTMLQKAGMESGGNSTEFALKNPAILKDIHSKYVDAGSDIIYAPTFSINRTVAESIGETLESAVSKLMAPALAVRESAKENGREVMVALDMGPQGQLLEPMGTRTFEEAYEIFADIVRVGAACGADIIVIETMIDLYETKAAVLAAKENSDLPVIVSMSFEENGRTFTGTSLEAMAITMEGLGVDAIGINCSLGPDQILPLAKQMMEVSSIPVFAKPNAGMPDPSTGEYNITPEEFALIMKEYMEAGISMVGGCCGTDPDCIRLVAEHARQIANGPRDRSRGVGVLELAEDGKAKMEVPRICSGNKVVHIDHVTVIGERLNPTGKKKMKQALLDGDIDYVISKAIEQVEAGAEVLDVNVGVPGIDEAALMPVVIKKLQSVTNTPLQIDSSNPAAIEAGLRVYNGKAIVNSVNGEPEVMDKILPIVKKYGAAVIGLALDDKGIPASAEARFEIAKRIVNRATEYGIHRENVIIDCLTLTVSAQQKEVDDTLRAVRMVHEKLGLRTALGVSNVSFGLPQRGIINRTFFIMAMENGLDLPIINPNDDDMMASVYAFNVLKNRDSNAALFIDRFGDVQMSKIAKPSGVAVTGARETLDPLTKAVMQGLEAETAAAVTELLYEKSAIDIVNDDLIPALDKVGKDFESGKLFLPQMMQAAQAAQAGFDVIDAALNASGEKKEPIGKVIIATVKGDIHDIGKNIVSVIMSNYGFEMIDLGKDVPVETIVDAVKQHGVKLVGLSALMTTTLASMEETIKAVKAYDPDCKVMVGGAVLTEDYAKEIGADYYCHDAMKSVEAAQKVLAAAQEVYGDV